MNQLFLASKAKRATWKKVCAGAMALSLNLSIGGVGAVLIGTPVAYADAFSYSIQITSANFSGSTITISGPADVTYVGKEDDQFVKFTWGDGSTPDVVQAKTLTNYVKGAGKTFTIHNWSKSHPYSSVGAYTVTVKIYHGDEHGHEGSPSESNTFTIDTENTAARCSDGTDNDHDGLIDLADPDCAAFIPPPPPLDTDLDTVPDVSDNCPFTPNTNQADSDHDGIGDACDTETTLASCTDGVDNDGDAATDLADSDCSAYRPHLSVTKIVTNNNGGNAIASFFDVFVDFGETRLGHGNGGVDVVSPYTGSHHVGETNGEGYTATYGGDCDANGNVTLAAGDSKSCTITNNDNPTPETTLAACTDGIDNDGDEAVDLADSDCAAYKPMITVIKHVDGGPQVASFFDIFVELIPDLSVAATVAGSEDGNTVSVDPGSYTVVEQHYDDYDTSYSGNCNPNNMVAGDTATCTVTNTYVPPPIPGCMNRDATNYNSNATVDDGSCTFSIEMVQLSLSTVGNGYVVEWIPLPQQPQILCGQGSTNSTQCAGSYQKDSVIELDAHEDVGWTFAGWSGGGCSWQHICFVTMDEAKSVTATFTAVPPPPVLGCTDEAATNFNPDATQDDGSCTYPPEPVLGCTDPEATNFNPEATQSDESCTYPQAPVLGCMNPGATNYNSEATQDDGSCTFPPPPPPPSGGGGSNTFDYWGCTNPNATNFNSLANKDDGSCQLPGGNGGGGTPPPATPPSGGGGGVTPPPQGEVLGASTEELPLPAGCSAYIDTFLKKGRKNDPEKVKLLQTFLNEEMSAGLPVTGFFGNMTHSWVKKFQVKHKKDILQPWIDAGYGGMDFGNNGTGYVYKTTKRAINMMKCTAVIEPMPVLVPDTSTN